jgi:hypothetical protein
MGVRLAYVTKLLLFVLGLTFYCEFLIYYFVLLQVSEYIINLQNCGQELPT